MEKKMFCFQCEQTGCGGCTGIAGVCGKKADTAKLQDELTGALIGLARSAESNEHMINSGTYKLIIEGMFTTLTNVNFDDNAIQNQIELVHKEKSRLIPNCGGCASPCGKNTDYDMSE
ncbi:MAG: hydroxylamine reductase, partial [Oscillospiraceae bacterium]|nr:hydroxylamine reductase [Oscillospiraceae bacterium]